MKRIWSILIKPPPSIKKPDQRFQSKLLAITILILVILVLLAISIYLIISDFDLNSFNSIGLVLVLVWIITYFITRKGYYHQAALIFIYSTNIALLTPPALTFGSPPYILIPFILAGLFLRVKEIIPLLVLNLVGIFLIVRYNPATPDFVSVLIGPFNFVFIFSVLILIVTYQRNLLERIRREALEAEKNKLYKEKTKLNHLLNSMDDGVLVLDQNQKVVLINKMGEVLSGFKQEELLDQPYNKYIHFVLEKDKKSNADFIDKVHHRGITTKMTNHTLLIGKKNKEISVASSAAPIKNRTGQIVGSVIVFRDITKERQIENMKNDFISFASHQLRTPLTRIRWFVELILSEEVGPLSDKQREYLEDIFKGSHNMSLLIEELLNINRIEAGERIPMKMAKIDLIPIIKEAIKEATLLADDHKIKVSLLTQCPKSCFIWGDGERIKRVFQNLLNNAIKYSGESKKIEISLDSDKNSVLFYVKDYGLGIPKKDQDKIFSRFFRSKNVEHIDGSGLGLFLSKIIIKEHKGKIWFKSKEKKGTTFYISLPIYKTKKTKKKQK